MAAHGRHAANRDLPPSHPPCVRTGPRWAGAGVQVGEDRPHDVAPGQHTGRYPPSPGTGKEGGNEDVCLIMLPARSNHPLGILAPGYRELGVHFRNMIFDLDEKAPENGFLGGSAFQNTSDRDSCCEVLNLMYFRSHEHLQAFAHSAVHRQGWDWWTKNRKDFGHIGISHEVYSVPAGRWETIYTNYHPAGFGATNHLVADEDGEKRWTGSLVDATKGRLRTAPGRMGLPAANGKENDKYYEV
ncbi:hypothetical protein BP5796_02299 [Coleophoma crateriformis]|uniref:Uncharacterized protein n=1 Tax=Coleophoma crateriformis TaxID=565419 RepID=A0A3D8SXX9_9HELO|nr:hypothetical protein BP5796_02299 [Coleophoma crateriformis]